MEFKEILELIKLVSKSNISGLKIKQGDFEIKISNKGEGVATTTVSAAAQPLPVLVPQVAQQAASTAEVNKPKTDVSKQDAASSNTYTFKSPMIGTFYRRPSPDKEVFVKVGDVVKNGDVLCIIEAMKLFNEIEFDGGEGRILKIFAEDSSPVEYDQPLFLIEKIG